MLSRHPDEPTDASGQTLVVAHSLPEVDGAAEALGHDQPMVDLVSDDDEDVKPMMKKEGDSSSRVGRYSGGRRGGRRGRNGGGGGIGY
jgi:hypothetical protein